MDATPNRFKTQTTSVPVFDYDSVVEAISPTRAVDEVREGFLRYACGDWQMPPKVYLDAAPNGDFRAMPAKGSGLAVLKWATSFPVNTARGLPVVMGLICVSRLDTGEPIALVNARAVTALRTGAVACVAAQELARQDAATVGIVGCGLHGSWAARCLHAAGFGPGVCFDARPEVAQALAAELGWEAGSRESAVACDIVTCVTPGHEPVVHTSDLHEGMHLSMLGADGPNKAEADTDVIAKARLFCDEWEQASHGGELTGAVEAGRIKQADVAELGEVEARKVPGRTTYTEITLFDSTGLAIQDLALCRALVDTHNQTPITSQSVEL
jgi:ornithine cyclodeaminase/alanine dehydrogenase-like protein (mu-crystallin family)